MYNLLLGLLVLDGVMLAIVILLQAGKGGGLAAMGGGAAAADVLGGRQATSLLTRATWFAGSAFMVLSLLLAILSSRSVAPASVLEGLGAGATSLPQPVIGEGAAPEELIPGLEGGDPQGGTPPPGGDAGGEVPPAGAGDPPPVP